MTPLAEENFKKAKEAAGKIWDCTILAGTVGSVAHGLNVGESEDLDIMGVCVEPIEKVVGLHPFEQLIYRTAAQRDSDHNARSQNGDVDMTIYSLRKYLRLALSGNPSILTLLFVPDQFLYKKWSPGMDLQQLASHLICKRSGGAFLGYMQAQRQRLLGERGGKHGVRADRINKFGYDSKYAMHILRLGLQGVELMETGKITLPFPIDEEASAHLRAVRQGQVNFESVMTAAGNVERRLKDAIDASALPDRPNEKAVESWMIETYTRLWSLGFGPP